MIETTNNIKTTNDCLLHVLIRNEGPRKLFWKIDPLSANPTKWSNTLKQFVGNSGQIV